MATQKTIVGQIDDGVLNFTVGRDPELDRMLVDADCIGTAAHVTMLSRIRMQPPVITEAECRRVIRSLAGIIRDARHGKFQITCSDQDVHLAVESRLTRQLGTLGRKVHTARSRNDQVAVDLRLFAKDQLLSLIREVLELGGGLKKLSVRHMKCPMVGRTHMQPAMPSSVGTWAAAYMESLLDDMVLVRAAYDINNRSPLGSAAGYGVALPVNRALTARLLGFRDAHDSVLYAANARGKCEAAILSALSQVMLTLSRLAEDMILYSMPEFGYFRLPPEFGTGSSIMPQKNNPDVLELIRAKAARVEGCASTASAIVRGLPGGYNRDLQEIKPLFIEGLDMTRASVRIMARLVSRLQVNKPALLAGFTAPVFATDRALELVAGGMPFRDAYRQVKQDLDKLAVMDPSRAVADRMASGGARVELSALTRRAAEIACFEKAENRKFHSALRKLFGREYSALSEREEK